MILLESIQNNLILIDRMLIFGYHIFDIKGEF